MKVVLIAPFATQPKGTTRARVLPLASALAGRGHQVTVLIPPWDYPAEAGREEKQDNVAVRWLRLPRPVTPRLSWQLATMALRERPDIVHIFKPKAHSGLALLWLWLRRPSLPRVLDSDDWEGRGGWNDVNPYTPTQKAFFQWQENFLPCRCAHAVTVASRTLQTQMWGLGLPPERVFYLPNGASQARYNQWSSADPSTVRAHLQLGDAPNVLLYTRFDRFRVERAVEVMARVIARAPEAKLLVVGRGFFGEEKELAQGMQARGLLDHLTDAGWTPEKDLPVTLAAGDVAFFPMDDTLINRANCSVKLLDLMAAGRAIVTDAVGENRETIEHLVSGWLTPPGDVEAQAGAIVTLLRDPSARQALGQGALQRLWQHYDWDRLVERVEAAYQAAGA